MTFCGSQCDCKRPCFGVEALVVAENIQAAAPLFIEKFRIYYPEQTPKVEILSEMEARIDFQGSRIHPAIVEGVI